MSRRNVPHAARPLMHGGTSFVAHEVNDADPCAPVIHLLMPSELVRSTAEAIAPAAPTAVAQAVAAPAEWKLSEDRSRTSAYKKPRAAARPRGRWLEVVDEKGIAQLKTSTESVKADTRRMLKGFLDRLVRDDGLRPLAQVPRHLRAALAGLRDEMPNFADAIDAIEKQLILRCAGDRVVQLPPLLLAGPPGIGKSRFAKRIAETLGVGYSRVGMETTTAGWVLAGSSTTWADGKPGGVANLLVNGATANSVLFLDEIDKAGGGERRYDPLGPLYALLEQHTARAWVDEAIEGVTFDASRLNVIAAANDISSIGEPLRSRFVVLDCRAPTQEERAAIAHTVYRELVIELGLRGRAWRRPLSAQAANQFAQPVDAPRHMRRMVQDAMASAIRQGRQSVTSFDALLAVLERLPPVDPGSTPADEPRQRGPGDEATRIH